METRKQADRVPQQATELRPKVKVNMWYKQVCCLLSRWEFHQGNKVDHLIERAHYNQGNIEGFRERGFSDKIQRDVGPVAERDGGWAKVTGRCLMYLLGLSTDRASRNQGSNIR